MFNLWEFPINAGNKILNIRIVKTPIMTDNTENIEDEYVLRVILAIRENNKRANIKVIKDYIEEECHYSSLLKLL